MGRIYLAEVSQDILGEFHRLQPNVQVNVLYSFGNSKNFQSHKFPSLKNATNSIVCDSGTFSKSNKSKRSNKITLDSYGKMCKEPESKAFDYIMNFDECFFDTGFKTNLKNLLLLEKQGIKAVPVVHDYVGKKEINYYINKQYPIIALGASKDRNKKNLKTKENIIYAANKILDAGIKVHLLGVTDPKILSEIPFTYCDSASWSKYGGLVGVIKWWNPQTGSIDTIYMLDKVCSEETNKIHLWNYKYRRQFEAYLDTELKLTIEDLMGHRRTFYRRIVNMNFFVGLEDIVREIHREKGFYN